MPFCHSPKSFVSKVVSIRRSKITGEEKIGKITSRGQKKKRQFEGKVIMNKRPLDPTHMSLKKEK
jgi:hypothetical protein